MLDYFIVRRRRGESWDSSQPMRKQVLWAEHAAFMDALASDGFVVLGGGLGDGEFLLAVDAPDEKTVHRRLAEDPWTKAAVLETAQVTPWSILLDGRDRRDTGAARATSRNGDVRLAEPGDSREISRLSAELGYEATPGEIRERLSVLCGREDAFVVVAVGEQPGLLGWVAAEERLVLESGTRTEIVGLVVDAKARRAGVGSRLVAEVENWTRARGVARIVVRSNILRNESHHFFRTTGFVRDKTQHTYRKKL